MLFVDKMRRVLPGLGYILTSFRCTNELCLHFTGDVFHFVALIDSVLSEIDFFHLMGNECVEKSSFEGAICNLK